MKIFLPLLLTFMFYQSVSAQQFNFMALDSVKNKPMLLGYCTRDAFIDTSFNWFQEEYDAYQPEYEVLDMLEGKQVDVDITIVLGTWCSDSREQVPRLYRILDELNYDADKINLICVNRQKTGLADEVTGLDIEFVPTFIFYKDKKEIGRIVETPFESLEKDLLSIF